MPPVKAQMHNKELQQKDRLGTVSTETTGDLNQFY